MRRWRGFTLIELLVVISIITLLIALLLPALRQSVEAAKMALCLSRQRQIFVAYAGYQTDNNLLAFPRRNWGRWTDHSGPETPIDRWHNDAYWGVAYADYAGRTALKETFNCPSSEDHDPAFYGHWYTDGLFSEGHIWATYGFNGLEPRYAGPLTGADAPHFIYNGNAPVGVVHADDKPSPTQLILFQDAYEHMLDGNGDMPWSQTQWNARMFREYFRHLKGGNVMWTDGHAATVPGDQESDWQIDWYVGL